VLINLKPMTPSSNSESNVCNRSAPAPPSAEKLQFVSERPASVKELELDADLESNDKSATAIQQPDAEKAQMHPRH
jgi:hypothetical protein